MYKRAEYQVIKERLEEPRKFIQVVMGPRQVGKSTVVKQATSICSMKADCYAVSRNIASTQPVVAPVFLNYKFTIMP